MRRIHPLGKARRSLPALTAALLAAGVLTNVHAQIQSAGDLFVDVDATNLPLGPVTSIENRGTLGGVFAASGGTGATPTLATVGGTKALQFDGGDFLQHMLDAEMSGVITAPAELTGENPTRSIEVWALNPSLANEEAMVSWGKRGGAPDGSNISFNYGSDFRWGAAGHWGDRDMGWNNTEGGPAAGKWHHLVYTYDGTTTRVYSDGALVNGEFLGAGAINTHPDTTILIGAQTEPDGVTVTGDLRFTGAIGKVRVHDGVLTAAQVANNYNFEKAAFIDPLPPQPPAPVTPQRLTGLPIHRWSFNETAGDATDSVFTDSIGDADGIIKGAGATFTGSRLILAGGPSATAAYGDLPDGLLSGRSVNNGGTGKITIETWVKVTAPRTWGRIFDFGSSGFLNTPTEPVEFPGGSGEGLDFLAYTSQWENDVNRRRLQLRNEDPAGGGNVNIDNATASFNTDVHLVVTWDEATGVITAYENGRQVSTGTTDDMMSDINDINNWLGRSNYLADQNFTGEFDEFRIYERVLTPGEILGNSVAGPNQFNNADIAPTFATSPVDTTAPQGSSVTFRAQAYGSSPLSVQWLRDGTPIANATNMTYTLPLISIADNNAQFSVRATSTVNGSPVTVTSSVGRLTVVPPTDRLTSAPIHRWSFNEEAGDAFSGSLFEDSIGDADGTVLGDGATFTGSRLVLPGGSSATQAYGDLPNGLLSSLSADNGGSGKFTFESWVRVTGAQNWARILDFGSSGTGDFTPEVEGPGGGGEGRDYLMYSASNGTDVNMHRLELRNEDPGGGGNTAVDNATTTFNSDVHVVITWDEATGQLVIYENGVQVSSVTADERFSDINDVNVWLGRSNFAADANFQGEYDEVRIYDTILSQRQALGNFIAGPGIINDRDIAPTIVTGPQSSTVPEGATITLRVQAAGSTPMAIQWFRNGVAIPGAVSSTLQLTNVTPADNNAVFTARISNTVNGETVSVTTAPATITVQPYQVTLKHRYSFSETEGTEVEDSVGNADGSLSGNAVFANGSVVLDGSEFTYVDLPNGIISGLGFDGTIELWITNNTSAIWARIFDFGVSNGGEDVNDGGLDFLFLTPRGGDGIPRFTANFPGGGDIVQLVPQPPGWMPPGEETHVVISWMASKNQSRMYIDGVLVNTSTAPRPLSDLAGQDINNWLGRSQFPDAYWNGSYNEVRISSGAMNDAQVAASFAAGPTSLPGNDTPPKLTATRNGNNLVISWPAAATGFVLESTTALGAGATWTPVAGATQNGQNMEVSVPMEGNARFFRLRK